MTFPDCHRCGAEVPVHEDGMLVFCGHCGAAQVQLSEALLTQVEEQERAQATPVATAAANDMTWRTALQCVAIAGAVTAACALLSALLAPAVLLVWLWIVISPVVVIGIFHARSPLTPLSASLGARIGGLTGIAVAGVLSIVLTAGMVLQRHFGLMAETDVRSTAMLDNMRAQVLSQPGGHTGMGWLDNLHVPEFRAGLVLVGFAMIVCILLAITTAGGAFAGYARSQRRG